jgi:hypothetical protein
VANTDFNATKVTTLNFRELGLDTSKTYTVYDFWNKKYRGTAQKSFACGAPGTHDVQLFALRELRPYPWIISTNRHISQGGIDLDSVTWDEHAKALAGVSTVVKGDLYMITLNVPNDYAMVTAKFGTTAATIGANNGATTIAFTPASNGPVAWTAQFSGGSGSIFRETSASDAKLKSFSSRGIIHLTGRYQSNCKITIFSLSGKVLQRFSGRGEIDIKASVQESGILLIRTESANRVENTRVMMVR